MATLAFAASIAAPAQAQSALSDREGYDTLLSCAAFFSAISGVAGDTTDEGKDASELATMFMTGAMLIAPNGDTARAEAELGKQAELFATAMLDESNASSADMDELLESCGTLGETYLPEVLARGQ